MLLTPDMFAINSDGEIVVQASAVDGVVQARMAHDVTEPARDLRVYGERA